MLSWLGLSPHSARVLGLGPVWTLDALPMPPRVWVYTGYSCFLSQISYTDRLLICPGYAPVSGFIIAGKPPNPTQTWIENWIRKWMDKKCWGSSTFRAHLTTSQPKVESAPTYSSSHGLNAWPVHNFISQSVSWLTLNDPIKTNKLALLYEFCNPT